MHAYVYVCVNYILKRMCIDMVKMILVNTREKYTYIRRFKYGAPAIYFLDKLYHIPPQSRHIRLVMYVVEYEPTSVEHKVEYYHGLEHITRDELLLYMSYPFYNFYTKEVKRYEGTS